MSEDLALFVAENARKLNDAIDDGGRSCLSISALRTVYDRYLLRHPETREVLETPQQFFLRVSCGLSRNVQEAMEFYRLISAHDYMPSSPTLFNSGTTHLADVVVLFAGFAGGQSGSDLREIQRCGAAARNLPAESGWRIHRVRSRGSLIRATNGHSPRASCHG